MEFIALRQQIILASGLALAALIPTSTTANEISAPSGWTDQVSGQKRILQTGSARIEVGPWTDLDGQPLRQWLRTYEKTAPPGAVFSASVAVKSGAEGTFYISRTIKFDGKPAFSVLHACPGGQGLGRLSEFHTRNKSREAIKSAIAFIRKACRNDSKNASIASVSAEQSASGQSVLSAAIAPDAAPPGLKEIRGVQDWGLGFGGMMTLKSSFIAMFEDGTYTEEFTLTFGQGINASQAGKPKSWGRWRMRGGELELAKGKSGKFEKTIGDWISSPGQAGQRLAKCYNRTRIAAGGVAAPTGVPIVGGSRTWCFGTDGRFSNSQATFLTADRTAGGVTGTSGSKEVGRYSIDGHTLRFVFDDGRETVAAFAFASDDKRHIMINGQRFIGN